MKNDGSVAIILQFECSLLPIPTPGIRYACGRGRLGEGGGVAVSGIVLINFTDPVTGQILLPNS